MFSIYRVRGRWGFRTEIVPHQTFRFEFDPDDVHDLHSHFGGLDALQEYLQRHLVDPDEADSLTICEHCSSLELDGGDLYTTSDGEVCESCRYEYYFSCEDCEDVHNDDERRWTLSERSICEGCCDYNYSYCESCEGYYNHDYDDHSHDCDCVAPAQTFVVRNDGEGMLANDTRAQVSLPVGSVDAEGILKIRRLLRQHRLYSADVALDAIGNEWQTKEGNLTKRLSRKTYNTSKEAIPAEVLSSVGTIAREHSTTASSFGVEVTRDLNQDPGEFAHSGSCWWGSEYESRCALKSNGGYALRSFRDNGYGDEVSGRAWVMPLKQVDGELMPTINTSSPDAFVVFNGYGELEGYAAARIVAHMAGMTYRKIGFDCGPMYVNSGGYLIAPEEIATNYTDGHLSLDVDSHSHLYDRELSALAATVNTEEKELVNA